MNQPTPLVLQPLPAPNPNAAQPNGNSIANALTTLSNEAPNIANANPMQQILAMNNNMIAVVATFNQLQTTVVNTINSVNAKLDRLPMRTHNASASPSTPLRYPPGIVAVAGGALPMTQASSNQCSCSRFSTNC